MAKNVIFEDTDSIQMPVLAGTVSGNVVITGMLVGVALTDRDANGNASVAMNKVVSVSVTASGNITFGEPIFITSATGALTDAAGAGKQVCGHAVSTSTGAGAKTIRVRLVPFAVPTDTAA